MATMVWAAFAPGARSALMDYAVPPPALNLAQLKLPAIAEAGPADLTSTRGMRDEAIRAFYQRRYPDSLDLLDRMAAQVNMAPNLQVLHAWATTYAGQDEPAAQRWAALAATSPEDAQRHEMAGWHELRRGQYKEAGRRYAQALRLNPTEMRLQLMMGLAAWGEGRLNAAQRMLVQAMQGRGAPPESALAMAALQADMGHYPESFGWLRKVMPRLDTEQRLRALSRPEFRALAAAQPAAWQDLRNELQLPDEATPSGPEVESDRDTPAPAIEALTTPREAAVLRLTPFAEEPRIRLEQIRAYQMEFTLRRLHANEQLEENALGVYETLEGSR